MSVRAAEGDTPPIPAGRRSAADRLVGRLTRGERRYLLLALPTALLLAVLFVYPLAEVVSDSVTLPELGLGNYERFFGDSVYLKVLRNTLLISLEVTVLCLLIGYPLAYRLATVNPRTLRILMLLVMLPLWTSVLVRSYAWLTVLGPAGVVNNLLIAIGIIEQPLDLVPGRIGLVVGLTQVMLPFMVIALTAVLKGIDTRLAAAAQSLGAGGWQRFRHIVLPLSMPGVAAGCALVFLATLGFYVVPALLGGPGDQMLSQTIELQVTTVLNQGFAGALATVLAVVTLVLYFTYSRLFRLDQMSSGGRG
jgi:putative spermidine/putrescine transport system permease protein